MNKTLTASLCLLAISVFGLTLFSTSSTEAGAILTTPPTPVVDSPVVPTDVSFSAGHSIIESFDDYSWRAFIALVWPGLKNQQGLPDTMQTVDGPGPRVFETYKSLAEVFHNDGSAPLPLNQYDAPQHNPSGVQAVYGDMTLGSFSKFSNLGQAGFGNLVGPLLSQNTNYVRFHTAFNNSQFNQILSQKWYIRANLPVTITFNDGSLDVKSAWILMNGIPHPERFYTRTAHVLDPVTGVSSDLAVGLVGLHIVQKTPTRPQWIWSSFEHVDNIPSPGNANPITFNDGTGTPMPANNPYTLNRVLQAPTPQPFNVTRIKPINPSTMATNNAYRNALKAGSIWRNYQLVMTQWPKDASNPNTPGTPANTFPGTAPDDATAFTNVTLETFDQRNIITGCMNCHNTVMKSADFVWTLSDHAFPAKSSTPNLLMKDEAMRKLRDILTETRKRNEAKE